MENLKKRKLPKRIKYETEAIKKIRKAAIDAYMENMYGQMLIIFKAFANGEGPDGATPITCVIGYASDFYARMIEKEGREQTQEDNNLFDDCVSRFISEHGCEDELLPNFDDIDTENKD